MKKISILQALEIAKIVRRSHKTKDCPHQGDCLTEKEMLKLLIDYLEFGLSEAKVSVLR